MATRDVFYFRFNESPANILPSDAFGNIEDLGRDVSALTLPPVVTGTPTGRGRQFAGSHGLSATDTLIKGNLTRAVTIVALLELDVAAQDAAGEAGTICHYGHSPVTWSLRLEVIDPATRLCTLRMYWQTATAGDVEPDGLVFEAPPSGSSMLVTATRYQEAGTVKVRYTVNGVASAALVSPAADPFDIGGNPAGGELHVGYRWSGAAASAKLRGVLDELLILSEELADEEAALQAEYFATMAPQGIAAVRALVPPGVYSRDPASDVQLELAIEGAALAYARASAIRLQRYMLPDVAWGPVLAGWERRLRLQPLPTDSIAERRTRILSHTEAVLGYDRASVAEQLDEVLGLTAAQVQVLELDNDYSEAFGTAADVTNNWLLITGNGSAPSVSGGTLRCAVPAAVVDIRYDGIDREKPPMALHAVDQGGQGCWIYGKVAAYAGATKAMAALVLGDRALDQFFFLGVYDEAGTGKVGWCRYKDGALSDVTVLQSGWTPAPTFFRTRFKADGTLEVEWKAADAGWGTPTAIASGLADLSWAGFALVCPSSQASVTGPMTADFDSYFSHAPNGRQRCDWYVYRDPLLGGVYDLEKANTLLQRIRPAHTRAAVIDTQVGIDVGSVATLTDRDMMGV